MAYRRSAELRRPRGPVDQPHLLAVPRLSSNKRERVPIADVLEHGYQHEAPCLGSPCGQLRFAVDAPAAIRDAAAPDKPVEQLELRVERGRHAPLDLAAERWSRLAPDRREALQSPRVTNGASVS